MRTQILTENQYTLTGDEVAALERDRDIARKDLASIGEDIKGLPLGHPARKELQREQRVIEVALADIRKRLKLLPFPLQDGDKLDLRPIRPGHYDLDIWLQARGTQVCTIGIEVPLEVFDQEAGWVSGQNFDSDYVPSQSLFY